MHQVGHFHAAGNGSETVLVVPETIWADALLVDKKGARLYVGYFRHPEQWDVKQRPHGVSDNLTGVYFFQMRGIGSDVKAHIFGRYFGQIGRRGEKFPGRFNGNRQALGAIKYRHSKEGFVAVESWRVNGKPYNYPCKILFIKALQ